MSSHVANRLIQRGATLLESMVALFILAMIGTSLAYTLSSATIVRSMASKIGTAQSSEARLAFLRATLDYTVRVGFAVGQEDRWCLGEGEEVRFESSRGFGHYISVPYRYLLRREPTQSGASLEYLLAGKPINDFSMHTDDRGQIQMRLRPKFPICLSLGFNPEAQSPLAPSVIHLGFRDEQCLKNARVTSCTRWLP